MRLWAIALSLLAGAAPFARAPMPGEHLTQQDLAWYDDFLARRGIVRIGEVGHASSVKVVTNMISAVTTQVLAEAEMIFGPPSTHTYGAPAGTPYRESAYLVSKIVDSTDQP